MHEGNTKIHFFFCPSGFTILCIFGQTNIGSSLFALYAESGHIIDTFQFIAFYCMGSLYSFEGFEWLKYHPQQDLKSNYQIDSSDHLMMLYM